MDKWEEFRKRILKVGSTRKHKITNSYGVYDAYKYYRKNKPKESKYVLKESQYFQIIRKINIELANRLLQNKDVNLPCHMGLIELRKYKTSVDFINGKLKTNMPIDWESTLKLWYEDKEAYKDKTLVRQNTKEVFKVYYNKINATYNNKAYYQFIINRDIKRTLTNKIKGKLIDAFTF